MKDAKQPSGLLDTCFPTVAFLLLVVLLLLPRPVVAEDVPSQNPFRWLGEFLGQPGKPADNDDSTSSTASQSESAPTLATDGTLEGQSGGRIADPLSVGIRLTLGITAPSLDPELTATDDRPCISKNRDAILFCVEPLEWPDELSAKLRVTSHMYQGNQSVVRFDGGQATYVHALIPSTAFNDAVAWYSDRLGTPDNDWERTINLLGGERQPNPTVVWRGIGQLSQAPVVLEIRKYDDTRGGFPDARRGAILLYQPDAEPIFPQLSSVELMAMRITDGTATLSDPVMIDPPTSDAATSSTNQSVNSRAGNPQPAPQQPTEQPAPVMAPQMKGANPFDPGTPIGTPDQPSQIEGKSDTESNSVDETVANGTQPTPGESAQSDVAAQVGPQRRIGFFGRLANSFKKPPEAARRPAPLVDEPAVEQVETLPTLIDTVLVLGDGFALGRSLVDDRESEGAGACETSSSGGDVICQLDLRWELGIAAAFNADDATKTARVTYSNGQSTSVLQRFPRGAFMRMKHHLENRYGPPTATLALVPAIDTDTDAAIRSFIWRSKSSETGVVTILEVSRLESARAESPFGAIVLYGEYSRGDTTQTSQVDPPKPQ